MKLKILTFLTILVGIITGCSETVDGVQQDVENAADEIEEATD